MIKKLLLGVLFLSFSSITAAQSLTINPVDNTARNNTSTFNLGQNKVYFSSGQVRFVTGDKTIGNYRAYGVSADRSLMAFIKESDANSNLTLTNTSGSTLSLFKTTELSSGDPSIAVYPANTGDVLVRNNIANFSFYDSFGAIITNLSGSSQSKGGEAISEVAMDPLAETIIIYTPKIKRDGAMGSQAQYVDHTMNLKSLFYSNDRFIKTLEVTNNGQFVIFITSKEGSEDVIQVTDRYGNNISQISTDDNLKGVRFSENAEYITAFSGNRVLIFDTISGSRIAGTSFKTELVEVNYFPKDNTIVALTGNYDESTNVVENIDFHAIDIEQRKVERKGYSSKLGLNEAIKHGFVRLGANRYKLEGASKSLEIEVSF